MKALALLFACVACAGVRAQDKPSNPEPKPASRFSAPSLVLTGVDATFTALDLRTTREILHEPGGYEGDPLWRPFIHSDRVYAVGAASNAGLAFLGARMRKSAHAPIRRLWWAPQAADIAFHVVGYAHNLKTR